MRKWLLALVPGVSMAACPGIPAGFVCVTDAPYSAPVAPADASSAFQAAVNANAKIWIPASAFSVVTATAVPANLTFNCATGATITAASSNTAAAGALLLTGTNVGAFQSSGCVFDGGTLNSSPLSTQYRLIYFNGSNGALFTQTTFQNNAGQGPTFSAVGGNYVIDSGVTFSAFNQIGIYNWTNHNSPCIGPRECPISVVGSALTFSNGDGVNSTGNYANNNTYTNIGSDAVDIQGMSGFTEGPNENVTLALSGWEPYLANQSLGVACIYVFAGVGNSTNISISGVNCTGATGNCFDIDGTAGITLSGNMATGCGGAGISISTAVTGDVVDGGNILQDNYQSINFTAPNNFPNLGHQGGLTYTCGKPPCTGIKIGGSNAANIIRDLQATQTQVAPVWVSPGVTLSGTTIGCNTTI